MNEKKETIKNSASYTYIIKIEVPPDSYDIELSVEPFEGKNKKLLYFAVQRLKEILPTLIKNGQVINLCFELLPETLRISIIQEINKQSILDYYIVVCCKYLIKYFCAKKELDMYLDMYDEYEKLYDKTKISFIEFIKKGFTFFSPFFIEDNKRISNLIKSKQYTSALRDVINLYLTLIYI